MMARIAYAFMVAAFLFLTIMYDFYTPFLAWMAVLLAPIPSAILAFRARKHLAVHLSLPARVTRGGIVRASLFLSAPGLSWLPLPQITAESLGKPAADKDGHFYFDIPAPHCGRQAMGPFHASVTDAFRLLSFSKEITSDSCIILPRRIGNYSAVLSALSRFTRPDEVEHFGAVEYKPGDDVHLINWKVTARKDALYVRDSLPVGSAALLLAADLPEDDDARDTVCDALYTLGSALLASKKSFSFLRIEGKSPILSEIRTESEWITILTHFLGAGRPENPLIGGAALVPPDMPVLYLTGEAQPRLPSMMRVAVWSADPAARADLAGRAAIVQALGGEGK